MNSGIYRLRNTATGDSYVGGSGDLEQRKRVHLGALRRGDHDNARLLASFREHGEASFAFEVLEECKPGQLPGLELRYIRSLNPCFNRSENTGRKVGGTTRARSVTMDPKIVQRLEAVGMAMDPPLTFQQALRCAVIEFVQKLERRRALQPH